MLERLGNVLYWGFAGLAALIMAGYITFLGLANNLRQEEAAFFGVAFFAIAVLIWLIGRACRYVLSGR